MAGFFDQTFLVDDLPVILTVEQLWYHIVNRQDKRFAIQMTQEIIIKERGMEDIEIALFQISNGAQSVSTVSCSGWKPLGIPHIQLALSQEMTVDDKAVGRISRRTYIHDPAFLQMHIVCLFQ